MDKKTKRKRGRPSTGFDKRAYMKEYMRNRRASKNLQNPKGNNAKVG